MSTDFTSRQDAAANAVAWATQAHAQGRQVIELRQKSADQWKGSPGGRIGSGLLDEAAERLLPDATWAREMALMWVAIAKLLPEAQAAGAEGAPMATCGCVDPRCAMCPPASPAGAEP